jgi:hypothetical protein
MSIFDNLFGNKKKPGRGGASVDDDTDPASYTRVITREPEAERRAPAADGWGDEPRPPTPAPAAAFEPTPLRPAPAYRSPEPPTHQAPAAPARPSLREASHPDADDGQTVYASVSRAVPTKVVAVLVCIEGSVEGHVVRIFAGENVIGRKAKPESESLPDTARTVSREHAKLVAEDGYFMVQPMRPENATLVNDVPVDSHEALQHGDRLTLGATKPSTFVLLVVP